MRTSTKRRAFVAALAAIATLSARSDAGADAIDWPPAIDCPDGAHGDSSHCGLHCDTSSCTEDGDCEDGLTCQDVFLCIETIECESGAGPFTQEVVTDACVSGGACDHGTCEQVRACAPDPDETSNQAWGCSCRAGGPSPNEGAWLLLLASLATIVIFRR